MGRLTSPHLRKPTARARHHLSAGLITGDSKSGIASADDFVWRLVKNCIDLAAGPESSVDLYLTPVDYVAAAIAYLSLQPASANELFHLVNSESPNLSEISNSLAPPDLRFAKWLSTMGGDCGGLGEGTATGA